jgi:hypothetical protein
LLVFFFLSTGFRLLNGLTRGFWTMQSWNFSNFDKGIDRIVRIGRIPIHRSLAIGATGRTAQLNHRFGALRGRGASLSTGSRRSPF